MFKRLIVVALVVHLETITHTPVGESVDDEDGGDVVSHARPYSLPRPHFAFGFKSN